MRNAHFWANYFSEFFIPRVKALTDFSLKRLLPYLDRAKNQADRVAHREYERLVSRPADEDADLSVLAEKAEEAALAYYETVEAVKQGLTNLIASALYHLFEQHFMFFYRRELLSPAEEHDHSLATFPEAIRRLRDPEYGIDVTSYPHWSKLDELRLVTNVVKHGEGRAADKLRLLRPELFVPPSLREQSGRNVVLEALGNRVPVVQPIGGEDLYVTPQDVAQYADAVVGFWRWLAQQMLERSARGPED